MTIQRIRTASGEVELTGVGYRPEGEARWRRGGADRPCAGRRRGMVLAGGSLANNAQLTIPRRRVADPGRPDRGRLPGRRSTSSRAPSTAPRQFERHAEVPFTSERKMMSVLVEVGGERTRGGHQGRARRPAGSAASPCRSATRVRAARRRPAGRGAGRRRATSPRRRYARSAWPTARSTSTAGATGPTSMRATSTTSSTSASSGSSTRRARRRPSPSPRRIAPASA